MNGFAPEQFRQRAPGHLALVKREHGLAALIGAAHPGHVTRSGVLRPGDTAAAGVDADAVALVDEQRRLDDNPDSSVAGL